jgi:hypothetical protein
MTFLVSYAWSKSIDDVSTDIGPTAQNPRDFRNERGVSDFDIPHILVASYLYELPFGKGKRFLGDAGRGVNFLLGGWQFGGIATFRSGFPFTPRINLDVANNGINTQRPNRTGSGKLANPTLDTWFNRNDFTLPAQFTFGNSGRNILRADGFHNWDLVLTKNTILTERYQVQFRVEAFNAFNHPNFGTPNNIVNVAAGGRVLPATDPRIVQFGLKLLF